MSTSPVKFAGSWLRPHRAASPVPRCGSWSAKRAFGNFTAASTSCAWWPTTITTGSASSAATARTARAMIGSPPSSCRTLARPERIRVPLPAARMIAATLLVVIEVRDFPGVGVLARRDQPVTVEGAPFGHVDGRAEEELDVVGGVALGGQLVVHDGLARVGVDFLIADQRHLAMQFVERESGAERLGRLLIDRDIVLVDEAIDDAAGAVRRMASGGDERRERRDNEKLAVSVSELEFPRGHHFFLNRASSLSCAPDFAGGFAAASLGIKYSQKLNRSLSTTRSAIGSRQLLL